jgi:peptidoglycan biosynthesis protein MviN/MurJ (putative lipid II flippase)
LLFVRGAFSQADASQVGHLLRLYALQVPFYLAASILGRILLSIEGPRPLALAAVIAVTATITANAVLIGQMGISGIPAAGVIVQGLLTAYLTAKVLSALSSTRGVSIPAGAIAVGAER